MDIDKDNLIGNLSKQFALKIIRLYKYLQETKTEFVISKQVLRSGTSIGANVHEALRGQSKSDFAAKMNIALKEASETEYWLELLRDGGYVSKDDLKEIMDDCIRINRILIAIVKTSFDNKA